jgi:hypothetical protein
MKGQSLLLALVSGLLLAGPVRGDEPTPSVQQIRSAASEYDAGRRAFVDKDFAGAAAHFENAFHDAPSAEALRNAIRAWRRAGQLARAATLAEVASTRYSKDAPTTVVVRETLAESATKLHKVTLTCSPECGLAADGRAITLVDTTQTIFFLEPGNHDLVVSWSTDRSKTQKFLARAGGRDEIALEAPPLPPPPPPPASVAVAPPAVAPISTVSATPPDEISRPKPLSPVLFIVGAAITAGGAGFTIWSGINAENDPGTAAVKTQCAGLGPTCPAYEKGQSAQLRTNIALGATGGVALVTAAVGIFFTRWSSAKPRAQAAAIEPFGGPVPGGGVAGVGGQF